MNEFFDIIKLARSENIGPVTYKQLLNLYGSATNALKAIPQLAEKGGRISKVNITPNHLVEEELKAAQKYGAKLIAYKTKDFPQSLYPIDSSPAFFWYLGDDTLLHKNSIAIVGARNASVAGRKFASILANDLGKAGYVITSGLARGIDEAAHKSSLQYGTIAVVAGGLDIIYPPEHKDLYHQVAQYGAIISEMPFATEPQARLFPRRNRIISGLSLGVIIVEAAFKSGSLVTANFALEQGKEVFAVPGSPLDPRSTGPNSLIKNGATLVQSSDDVLNALQYIQDYKLKQSSYNLEKTTLSTQAMPTEQTLNHARQHIKELLSPVPISIDELANETQIPVSIIQIILLELELAGRLERHIGGTISIIPDLALS
jgi:DNA processing protein